MQKCEGKIIGSVLVNHLNQLQWTSYTEPVNCMNQWTTLNCMSQWTIQTSEPPEPVNHLNQWTTWVNHIELHEPVNNLNQWTTWTSELATWTSELHEPVNHIELHEPVNHPNQWTTWIGEPEPVNHLNQWTTLNCMNQWTTWTSELHEPVNCMSQWTAWTSEPPESVIQWTAWTSEPPEPVNHLNQWTTTSHLVTTGAVSVHESNDLPWGYWFALGIQGFASVHALVQNVQIQYNYSFGNIGTPHACIPRPWSTSCLLPLRSPLVYPSMSILSASQSTTTGYRSWCLMKNCLTNTVMWLLYPDGAIVTIVSRWCELRMGKYYCTAVTPYPARDYCVNCNSLTGNPT